MYGVKNVSKTQGKNISTSLSLQAPRSSHASQNNNSSASHTLCRRMAGRFYPHCFMPCGCDHYTFAGKIYMPCNHTLSSKITEHLEHISYSPSISRHAASSNGPSCTSASTPLSNTEYGGGGGSASSLPPSSSLLFFGSGGCASSE
jgi:hypothetical protein